MRDKKPILQWNHYLMITSMTRRNQVSEIQEILVPDWLITSHVTSLMITTMTRRNQVNNNYQEPTKSGNTGP